MADLGDISVITFPNGNSVSIKDAIARTMTLDVTYTPGANNTPGDLAFEFTTAANADNEEF